MCYAEVSKAEVKERGRKAQDEVRIFGQWFVNSGKSNKRRCAAVRCEDISERELGIDDNGPLTDTSPYISTYIDII